MGILPDLPAVHYHCAERPTPTYVQTPRLLNYDSVQHRARWRGHSVGNLAPEEGYLECGVGPESLLTC